MNFLCLRCREETERFFLRQETDPRYCFELFRRAIITSDQFAWDCLYHRYYRLVSSWVERHPLYQMLNEDTDMLVNLAFEKMWSVLSAEKFTHFLELKALLRYLQLCVHSVMVDLSRGRERTTGLEQAHHEALADSPVNEPFTIPAPEAQVAERMQSAELWGLLESRIKNEKERHVLEGMFVLALKPAEVFALYPGSFQDVREVYQVRDNLLARLRRDAQLKALYEAV